MTFDELLEEVIRRGGLRLRLRRRLAGEALRLALERWPARQSLVSDTMLAARLRLGIEDDLRARRRVEQSQDFNPLALWALQLVISLVVRALIDWWSQDRAARGVTLDQIRLWPVLQTGAIRRSTR